MAFFEKMTLALEGRHQMTPEPWRGLGMPLGNWDPPLEGGGKERKKRTGGGEGTSAELGQAGTDGQK